MDTTYVAQQSSHNAVVITPTPTAVRDSPLRLSTFQSPVVSNPVRTRDREEHSGNGGSTNGGGGRRGVARNNRENIATLGLRNALGLRRRHLFSSIQNRTQRHSSERAHERRLLR